MEENNPEYKLPEECYKIVVDTNFPEELYQNSFVYETTIAN